MMARSDVHFAFNSGDELKYFVWLYRTDLCIQFL